MAKILWIEDDYEIISDLPFQLEAEGHEFTLIESKKDFLDLEARFEEYDLVIVDLIIPQRIPGEAYKDYPGLDVIRIIRKELKSRMPIVVLTVVQNAHLKEELDVDLVLHKGGALTPTKFKEGIESCLEAIHEKKND